MLDTNHFDLDYQEFMKMDSKHAAQFVQHCLDPENHEAVGIWLDTLASSSKSDPIHPFYLQENAIDKIFTTYCSEVLKPAYGALNESLAPFQKNMSDINLAKKKSSQSGITATLAKKDLDKHHRTLAGKKHDLEKLESNIESIENTRNTFTELSRTMIQHHKAARIDFLESQLFSSENVDTSPRNA